MGRFPSARFARGLAVATSLAVAITCDSPVAPGHTEVEGLTAVTANAFGVTSVTVTFHKGQIAAGEPDFATAKAHDDAGNVIRRLSTTWRSDNTAVATVEPNGFIRGRSDGTANIIATIDGVSGQATLTVGTASPPPPPPPPAATQLAMVTQPASSAQSGVAFGTQPAVGLRDDSNNPVNQAGVAVTAIIASGGGVLGGTLTALTDAGGVARFTNLSITGVVGIRTLSFSASALIAATSAGVAITAGAATQLSISTQPSSSATAGQPFATQPAVQLRDASSNLVANPGVTVTAAASSGGTLGGVTSAGTDASGVATFSNLAITSSGTYTLTFASPGLTPATSNAITITVSPPPPPPPPPTGCQLLFASDWGSATGTSATAIRDASKAIPWTGYAPTTGYSAVETVAAAGLDARWPAANAFVVRADAGQLSTKQIFRDLGAPASGTQRFFRVYVAMLWADSHGAGTNGNLEHGIESADAELGGGDGFNIYMVPRADGTWFPGFREISTGYRYVAEQLRLSKRATYRLEWRIAYGTGSYTVEIRIFDGAGTLVASTPDFLRVLPYPQGVPLNTEVLSLAATGGHRWFRVGSNGPSSNYPLANISAGDAFRAHGGVAVGQSGWCGPYVAGERP